MRLTGGRTANRRNNLTAGLAGRQADKMQAKHLADICKPYATSEEAARFARLTSAEAAIFDGWQTNQTRQRALECVSSETVTRGELAELRELRQGAWHVELLQRETALLREIQRDGLPQARLIFGRVVGTSADPRERMLVERAGLLEKLTALGFITAVEGTEKLIGGHPVIKAIAGDVNRFEVALRGLEILKTGLAGDTFAVSAQRRIDELAIRLSRARQVAQQQLVTV